MRNRVCALALFVSLVALSSGCRPSKLRAPIPPPAAKIEAKPAAPPGAQTFIPGAWTYEDDKEHWLWRPGYYAKTPVGAKSYQRGKWVKRGFSWVWLPGKWLK